MEFPTSAGTETESSLKCICSRQPTLMWTQSTHVHTQSWDPEQAGHTFRGARPNQAPLLTARAFGTVGFCAFSPIIMLCLLPMFQNQFLQNETVNSNKQRQPSLLLIVWERYDVNQTLKGWACQPGTHLLAETQLWSGLYSQKQHGGPRVSASPPL